MKILALLSICCGLSAAELTLSAPLAIDQVTHSSVRACWSTAGAVLASKQMGFDTTANFNTSHVLAFKTNGLTTVFASSMCMNVTGLAANIPYTFCPILIDGSGNTTNCTNTGNANSRAAQTTSTLPSPHPALPIVPSTFDTSYPAIDTTLTIANDCSNRAAQITAAYGAGNNNKTVKLVYPSFGTQTNVACNAPLNLMGITKSGTGWVVIASSDEATGPGMGVRTSPSNKSKSWVLCTSGNTSAFSPISQTRLVDMYLEPCDSAAVSGNGDPQITNLLFDFNFAGVSNVVCDRCEFDGRGYPYRVQYATWGYGNDIAFINSSFDHIEVWEPWVDTTSISISGNQIISSLAFLMGHGDTTNTIGTFTVTQSSGTGTAWLIERGAGAIEYRYSNGSASCSSPCTAVLDAGMTYPSDAVSLMWNGSRLISYTAGNFGSQTFVNRQNITNLKNATGTVQDNEWNGFGINANSCSSANPTAQVWMAQNNYLGVTGFAVFPQGDCSPNGASSILNVSDWTISGNDIQANNNCLVAFGAISIISSPFVCVMRHHIEMKNGQRFSITHNTMTDGFVDVTATGYALDVKNDFTGSGQTVGSYVQDIYFGYNTITNSANCIYIAGEANTFNGAQVNSWGLITRIEIEQNICQVNSFTRDQFFTGATQSGFTYGAMTLWVEGPIEDLIMQHNTIYQPRGDIGSVVLYTDRWSEGQSILNNIFYVMGPTDGAAYRGITASWLNDPGFTSDSTPPINTATGSDGTTGLNNGVRPNATWDVRGNLFISACLVPSTCNDATAAGSLVGDLSAQYPASNFWITSGTFGARQDAVGWVNRSSVPAGLYLSSLSTYHSAGTDGQDIGVFVGNSLVSSSISGQVTISGSTDFR